MTQTDDQTLPSRGSRVLTVSPSWATARILVGVFFAISGLAKLTYTPVPGVAPGLEGFAAYLAAAGAPFPLVSAALVCATEVLCGVALAAGAVWRPAHRVTRWVALPLAVEMAVAMALVGVPTALGDPVTLNGTPVTAERFRLPLELGLFSFAALLAWRGR